MNFFSELSKYNSGFSTLAVLAAVGIVIISGAVGARLMSHNEQPPESKLNNATSTGFYNSSSSIPTTTRNQQPASSQDQKTNSSQNQAGSTTKPDKDSAKKQNQTQQALTQTYQSKKFNFSFSYPAVYPEFSDQVPPSGSQQKPNVRRYKRASNEPPLSNAITLKENKIAKKDGYPTLHLHVTDLENYFYRFTSAGVAIEYNAATQSWYETSPVGENRKSTSLDTVSVGGRTGYTFRSGDAGFAYDGVAIPYPEENVMIELGFTVSPSTEKSISQRNILQSFRFHTSHTIQDSSATTTDGVGSPENSSATTSKPVTDTGEKEYLLVRGRINLPSNTASFRSFSTARTTPRRAKAISAESGEYDLIAYGNQGQKVSEVSFAPSRAIADPGGPTDNASFTIAVEKQKQITRVTIKKDGEAIADKTASDNPPSVEVVHPNGGENLTGKVDIRWKGSDPDGDDLEYTVSYSNNGGDTFKALRTSWPRNSTKVGPLAGAKNGLVKVQASDGFNTATDISDNSFQVPNRKPDVRISDPGEGQTFDGSRRNFFSLEGWVQDPEDGLLSGDSLVWKSSKDGILVTGKEEEVYANEMTAGDHIITLEATDSDGVSSIATTSITITKE